MNIAQAILGTVLSFAQPTGAVLLCNPYGCRSSPYYPPPVYLPAPRVSPPVPAQVTAPPRYRPPRGGAPISRPNVQVPPPDDSRPEPLPDREAKVIEGDIMVFCDNHPDEQFCGKLGAYLRAHPESKRR
jgi:hypothetical protein